VGAGQSRTNLEKHGIDFEDAVRIFDGPVFLQQLRSRRRTTVARNRVGRERDCRNRVHDTRRAAAADICQEGITA